MVVAPPVVAPPARRSSRASGFTLIELAVVGALLALLAALAGPSMSQLIVSQRVKSAASDLHLTLLKARSEAIKRNTRISVTPITGTDWSTGWSIVTGGTTLDVTQSKGNVSVTAAGGLASVTYRPDGRTTSAATMEFTVTDTSASATRCVSIDPAGRPYAKEGACI